MANLLRCPMTISPSDLRGSPKRHRTTDPTEQLRASIPISLMAALLDKKDQTGRTISNIVQCALIEYLYPNHKEEKP